MTSWHCNSIVIWIERSSVGAISRPPDIIRLESKLLLSRALQVQKSDILTRWFMKLLSRALALEEVFNLVLASASWVVR